MCPYIKVLVLTLYLFYFSPTGQVSLLFFVFLVAPRTTTAGVQYLFTESSAKFLALGVNKVVSNGDWLNSQRNKNGFKKVAGFRKS